MAIPTEGDTLSISELGIQTQRLVEQVETTKRPLVITRQGHSTVVLIDAEAYELQQRRLALMEHIAKGKQDVANGKTYTQEEAEALLDEWM
ncbi:MAG TPA: type II toxin-antitoxin system Phd/YefM family antitoxin [Chthonomonadaceae bacterium]|nr:type II toxin-antitoxin system Phd/YefM family antitoxin [Chthonomonadaceae bacterium]